MRSSRLHACLVVALALALRLATAGSQDLWYDEVFTARIVDGSFRSMLDGVADLETTPPLSYVIGWAWAHVAGDSAFALRVPAAAAGAVTAWLGMRLAGRLAVLGGLEQAGATRAATCAGLLLAVDPMLVWYGQEARAYALLALCALGSLAALVELASGSPTPVRACMRWSAWSAAALATHYVGWLCVAAGAMLLLGLAARRRVPVRAATLALVLPAATAAALVPLLLHHRAGGRTSWIGDLSLAHRILQVPQQFVVGLEAPAERLLAIVLLLALAWLVAAALRRASSLGMVMVLAFAALVFALALLAAVGGQDLVLARNLLPCLPPLLVVAGLGAATRALPLAAGTILVLLAVTLAVQLEDDYRRPDWSGAVAALPGDATLVAVVPSLQEFVVRNASSELASEAPVRPRSVRSVTLLVGPVIPGGGEFAAPDQLLVGGVPARVGRTRSVHGGVAVVEYVLAQELAVLAGTLPTVEGADAALLVRDR